MQSDHQTMDKVALITGGSRGIGYETAKHLAKRGVSVVICSRNLGEIEDAALRLKSETGHGNIIGLVADVSVKKEVDHLFSRVTDVFGRLDILVNNAGFLALKTVDSMTEEDWDISLARNLKSVFLCSQHAMRMMQESKETGYIVNVSSLSGVRFVEKFGGMSAYIASKHGVIGLTEALAVEGAPNRVRVNCVAPGSVRTKMFQDNFPDYQAGGSPEEIARVIGGFCDEDQLGWQTGNVFEIFCNAS